LTKSRLIIWNTIDIAVRRVAGHFDKTQSHTGYEENWNDAVSEATEKILSELRKEIEGMKNEINPVQVEALEHYPLCYDIPVIIKLAKKLGRNSIIDDLLENLGGKTNGG